MNEVWIVSHGDYSDYCVECVFELAEDAGRYAELSNIADVRRTHDVWHNSTTEYGQRHRAEHERPFEECPACQKKLAQGEKRYGAYRVERFAFHPAGEIPHGDASNQERKPE